MEGTFSKKHYYELKAEVADGKTKNNVELTPAMKATKQAQIRAYEVRNNLPFSQQLDRLEDAIHERADHIDEELSHIRNALDTSAKGLPDLLRHALYDVLAGKWQPPHEESDAARIANRRAQVRHLNSLTIIDREAQVLRTALAKIEAADPSKAPAYAARIEKFLENRLAEAQEKDKEVDKEEEKKEEDTEKKAADKKAEAEAKKAEAKAKAASKKAETEAKKAEAKAKVKTDEKERNSLIGKPADECGFVVGGPQPESPTLRAFLARSSVPPRLPLGYEQFVCECGKTFKDDVMLNHHRLQCNL
jgi:hypothetical protein